MIITQTPLRVSFLGGNTDLPEYFTQHGGMVLTTTIDKYIYCIVKERYDDLIYVNYSIKEIIEKVEDIKHDLVRESLKLLGITKGIEISFLSDIPSKGSGLGSSSSVTVGLLNALHAYLGNVVSNDQLALEACNIELIKLKKPIGVQDQYIAALGGLRWLYFLRSGRVVSDRINLPDSIKDDLDNSLMLFFTGITRQSDSILAGLNVKKNKEILHKNKELAKKGVRTLKNGKIYPLGKYMDSYWEMKKTLSNKISNSDIDSAYEKAMGAGALGGKILGAGGGGYMLLMVPENKRSKVREVLKSYTELPFRLTNDGTKVIFNN